MKYYYSISYLNSDTKEKYQLQSFSKMWIISEYLKLLTNNNQNISDLKLYKTNSNTFNYREITGEVNKFLYK